MASALVGIEAALRPGRRKRVEACLDALDPLRELALVDVESAALRVHDAAEPPDESHELVELITRALHPTRDPSDALGQLTERALETANALESCPQTLESATAGEVSLGQAGEIVRTEAIKPGCEAELLGLATGGLTPLRNRARRIRQDAIDVGPDLRELLAPPASEGSSVAEALAASEAEEEGASEHAASDSDAAQPEPERDVEEILSDLAAAAADAEVDGALASEPAESSAQAALETASDEGAPGAEESRDDAAGADDRATPESVG